MNLEIEPHANLKPGSAPDSLDEPSIKIRFDVEDGEAQTVRDELRDQLGEDGIAELESQGFMLFTKSESTYKFIGKPVPLAKESDDYDPISAANSEIQNLLEIIEDHADEVAAKY